MPLCLGIDIVGNVADDHGKLLAGLHHVFDLADRGEHRGVVSALKLRADIGERHVREIPAEIHGDLPRRGGVLLAGLPAQRLLRNGEVPRRFRDDDVRRGDVCSDADHVLDGAADA